MKRPDQNFLCSFKCPFCGDRVEVTTEIKPDGWTAVIGACDSNTSKICGMDFDFGIFGTGVNRQTMKDSVMDVVGINFIN